MDAKGPLRAGSTATDVCLHPQRLVLLLLLFIVVVFIVIVVVIVMVVVVVVMVFLFLFLVHVCLKLGDAAPGQASVRERPPSRIP